MKRLAAALIGIVAVIGIGLIVWRQSASPPADDGGTTPSTNTQPQVAAQSRIPPYSPALVERLTSVLRDAGVDVLPDETVLVRGDASAVNGFALSEFQVQNMAREIADDAGGGFYGAQIDEMIPLPTGAPPMSYFIAAWMARASTPAAKAAADLMGPRNWTRAPEVVFPMVVLAAFAGEAVRAAAAESAPQAVLDRFWRSAGGGTVMAAGLMLQGGLDPCAAINSFVNGMLTKVFEALKIKSESGGVLGFIADLYNAAVDFAKGIVAGLLKFITAPIADALRIAVGLVGVVSYAGSLLKGWSVKVEAVPALTHYAIDKEPAPTGAFTARIQDAGFTDWPQPMKSCAQLFDVELPSTDADVGSRVTWSPLGGARSVLARGYRDETLPASKVARLEYTVTGRETKQDAVQGKVIDDVVTVQAGFERRLVTKLQQLLKGMILGAAGPLSWAINPFLGPRITEILGKLAKYLDENGSAVLTVRHHSLVRCLLFTREEASAALRQPFTIIAAIPPTGCAAGIPDGGPNVGYYYSAGPCALAHNAAKPTGINPLKLGEASFYTRVGDRHRVAFPAVSRPLNCVMLDAGPVSSITAGSLVRFAGTIRPRS